MSSPGGRDLTETFQDFLTGCAKVVLGLGSLATLASVGLLVFTCFRVGGATPQQTADAVRNVDLFNKVLSAGVVGIAVGATYLWWGEELLGVLQLMLAAALYFAPFYMPMVLGDNNTSNDAVRGALAALQQGGSILGALAVAVLLVDVVTRVRQRAKQGVKADQLKYGKGIKEEWDKQNVFMGKCWQLPYCRKFVRERCPIYHAKRTCWKERTGCMCEEEVIRSAMENRPIPKDELLASKMIPHNHKLTEAQKFDRCKSCVIYNEHQKHKYRAWLPGTLVGFVLVYVLFRGPLLSGTEAMIEKVNRVIGSVTLGAAKANVPHVFVELLLIVFFLIALSYALKVLEYVIFKLKL